MLAAAGATCSGMEIFASIRLAVAAISNQLENAGARGNVEDEGYSSDQVDDVHNEGPLERPAADRRRGLSRRLRGGSIEPRDLRYDAAEICTSSFVRAQTEACAALRRATELLDMSDARDRPTPPERRCERCSGSSGAGGLRLVSIGSDFGRTIGLLSRRAGRPFGLSRWPGNGTCHPRFFEAGGLGDRQMRVVIACVIVCSLGGGGSRNRAQPERVFAVRIASATRRRRKTAGCFDAGS